VCQGFNPLLSFPNRAKVTRALSSLKFLVVMDPLDTETANFWQNHGEFNNVDAATINTEVIQLPTTCFAEEEGSLTNSGRWLQWHWPGADAPGEAQHDTWIIAQIHLRMKALYAKEGGKLADPILNLDWQYKDPDNPTPAELARELNGRALEDVTDPTDKTNVLVPKGKQLPSFALLRDDGSTTCGCWIYAGCYTEAGNAMARRNNNDPGGAGLFPGWAFAWPINRRILYNRASCDLSGRPWDPARKIVEWDGKAWIGYDIPDTLPDADPETVMPFIMDPEGASRLWVRGLMVDGPFPTHYEPFEAPIVNVLAPKVRGNPAARVFADDMADFGDASEFPIVGTSYRLTEHFHFWTKHNKVNAMLQPEFFVELSEQLAKEKGIVNGSWVRVWSKRGSVKAVACVTKRLQPLTIDGKTVHMVGVPLHWGFMGVARKGFGPNSLTPSVGDANVQTPEFKAFLLNIEPSAPPATPSA
jgi:formate dehydrogenase major subunit